MWLKPLVLSCKKPIIGIRPGEKIHEEMITVSDSYSTIDLGNYYAILPSDGSVQRLYADAGLVTTSVEPGFAYNSGTNSDFLSVQDIRDLIRQHLDPTFSPI